MRIERPAVKWIILLIATFIGGGFLLAPGTQEPAPQAVSDWGQSGQLAIDNAVMTEPVPEATDPATEAMMELQNEPAIRKVLYTPDMVVDWHIAVDDDGSKRYGYAGYVCQILARRNLVDQNTVVRIIDEAKRADLQDAYRDYSLGAVVCATDQHFD